MWDTQAVEWKRTVLRLFFQNYFNFSFAFSECCAMQKRQDASTIVKHICAFLRRETMEVKCSGMQLRILCKKVWIFNSDWSSLSSVVTLCIQPITTTVTNVSHSTALSLLTSGRIQSLVVRTSQSNHVCKQKCNKKLLNWFMLPWSCGLTVYSAQFASFWELCD